MKVTMLVDTTHEGERLLAGDVTDIPEAIAQRWIKNRIAGAEKVVVPVEKAAPAKRSPKPKQ